MRRFFVVALTLLFVLALVGWSSPEDRELFLAILDANQDLAPTQVYKQGYSYYESETLSYYRDFSGVVVFGEDDIFYAVCEAVENGSLLEYHVYSDGLNMYVHFLQDGQKEKFRLSPVEAEGLDAALDFTQEAIYSTSIEELEDGGKMLRVEYDLTRIPDNPDLQTYQRDTMLQMGLYGATLELSWAVSEYEVDAENQIRICREAVLGEITFDDGTAGDFVSNHAELHLYEDVEPLPIEIDLKELDVYEYRVDPIME